MGKPSVTFKTSLPAGFILCHPQMSHKSGRHFSLDAAPVSRSTTGRGRVHWSMSYFFARKPACHPLSISPTLRSLKLLCVAHVAGLAVASNARADEAVSFDKDIAPLIARRCLQCHRGAEPDGDLDLSRRESALRGGESGVVLKPGDPAGSRLWRRVESEEMPPDEPLPAAERQLLRDWIASGANWGQDPIDPFRYSTDERAGYDWWSLQRLSASELPAVNDASWCRNPVDRFVLARLENHRLRPSSPASRRVLVRRLYFDLLGLPPSPQQVEAVRSTIAATTRMSGWLTSCSARRILASDGAAFGLTSYGLARATALSTTSRATTRGPIATG